MKSIKQHINEALKINSKSKVINTQYNYFPKSGKELIDIIDKRIKSEGNECDLNDIDTSKIKDMSNLFNRFRDFNGDISKWDVSNVKFMIATFQNSEFNGDISKWDVSNVIYMGSMFKNSEFNSDISDWNVSNVVDMYETFMNSKFNQDISKWDVSNVKIISRMFALSQFNQDISNWDVSNRTSYKNPFKDSPLANKPHLKPAKIL